jgi:hypothetical protein
MFATLVWMPSFTSDFTTENREENDRVHDAAVGKRDKDIMGRLRV